MTTKTKTTCVRDKASAKAWRTMPVTDLFDKLPVGKRYDQRTVFPYGKVPVIDQGKSGVICYHNEEPGIRASEEKPIVTFANHTCQVTLQKRNFSVIQNVFPLKAKEGVDPWFLYYRIRDAIKFQEYKGHWPDFVMLQFLVPPHNEQKRIAEMLSAFDEKIENNNRIIKALDETAQATFKEWFVNFRFPDSEKAKFADSELGKIPKGWEVKTLGNVIELAYGRALKEENRQSGDVVVVGSSGIVGRQNQKLVSGPGIVVGRKGVAGSVIWIDEDFYPIDTTFYVKTKLPLIFCFLMLKRQNFITGDSAVPGLNREDVQRNIALLPDAKMIEQFRQIAEPMFHQKFQLENENKKLAAMRDLLLPRLMSGEIRV